MKKIEYYGFRFNFTQYVSMDIVKQHKVMPFEINENRITLIIAHKLSTITNADKIIVMKKNLYFLLRPFVCRCGVWSDAANTPFAA